jgi:pyruvate,water dikinase
MANFPNVVWLEHLRRADVPLVGGKNASLGEMVGTLSTEGVRVPLGFATTADAYWRFVDENVLRSRVTSLLADHEARKLTLAEVGQAIRIAFLHGEWPSDIADEIRAAYRDLSKRAGTHELDVAVRSSATAEDLPEASFAGQQETFLGHCGPT